MRDDPVFNQTLEFAGGVVRCPAATAALSHAELRSEAGRRGGTKSAESRRTGSRSGSQFVSADANEKAANQLEYRDRRRTYVELSSISDKSHSGTININDKHTAAAVFKSGSSGARTALSEDRSEECGELRRLIVANGGNAEAADWLWSLSTRQKYMEMWTAGRAETAGTNMGSKFSSRIILAVVAEKIANVDAAEGRSFESIKTWRYFDPAISEHMKLSNGARR
jgi:hypothetical protein